jgi:hypothetical protein
MQHDAWGCRYKARDYFLVLAITAGVMMFFLTGRVSAKNVGNTTSVVAWGGALMLGCCSWPVEAPLV